MRRVIAVLSVTCVATLAGGCKKGGKDKDEDTSASAGNPSSGSQGSTGTIAITGSLSGAEGFNKAMPFAVTGSKLSSGGTPTAIAGGQLALTVPGGSQLTDDEDTIASTVIMVFKKEEGESALDAFDSMTFVSVPTSEEEGLVSLATSKAKVDTLELGTIAKDGEDLVADQKIGTEQIDLPQEAIAETATLDDAMRVLKNEYANAQGEEKGTIKGVLEFYWDGALVSSLGADTDPKDLTFLGWSPALHFDHPDFTFNTVCDATAATFKLFEFKIPQPGVKRNLSDSTWITALTNTGATPNTVSGVANRQDCGAGSGGSNTYIGGGTTDNPSMYMNFGGGEPFQTEIPDGTWTVELAGELKAKFDLALSYPLIADPDDATKLIPRVYVPIVKTTADATTGKFQKAELWFALYDKATGTYERVTDYTTMKQFVSSVSFTMDSNVDGQSPLSEGMSKEAGYTFPDAGGPWVIDGSKLTNDWRVKSTDRSDCPDPTGYKRIDMIGVQYIMYDNRYSFNIKLPANPAGSMGQNCI